MMGGVVGATARSSEPELREVEIDRVVVHPERFRPLGELGALAESIKEIGLTSPIKVNAELVLLNGRHRLKACQMLGWKTIRAFVYDVDQLRQELIGIDDDLCRKELTPLERGERMARKKEIYETLYPETRPKVIGALASNRAQAKGDARAPCARASFVTDTVEKTGLSRRVIQEEIQIARGIAPSVRDRIRGTDTATKKRILLRLARVPVEAQEAAVGVGGGVDEQLLDAAPIDNEPQSDTQVEKKRGPRGRLPTADEGIEQLIAQLENTSAGFDYVIRQPGDQTHRAKMAERLAPVLTTLRRVRRSLAGTGE